MGTNVNVSDYSLKVLKGLKMKKGHKNYDSALREIFMTSDIDEDELIEFVEDMEEKENAGDWL